MRSEPEKSGFPPGSVRGAEVVTIKGGATALKSGSERASGRYGSHAAALALPYSWNTYRHPIIASPRQPDARSLT